MHTILSTSAGRTARFTFDLLVVTVSCSAGVVTSKHDRLLRGRPVCSVTGAIHRPIIGPPGWLPCLYADLAAVDPGPGLVHQRPVHLVSGLLRPVPPRQHQPLWQRVQPPPRIVTFRARALKVTAGRYEMWVTGAMRQRLRISAVQEGFSPTVVSLAGLLKPPDERESSSSALTLAATPRSSLTKPGSC